MSKASGQRPFWSLEKPNSSRQTTWGVLSEAGWLPRDGRVSGFGHLRFGEGSLCEEGSGKPRSSTNQTSKAAGYRGSKDVDIFVGSYWTRLPLQGILAHPASPVSPPSCLPKPIQRGGEAAKHGEGLSMGGRWAPHRLQVRPCQCKSALRQSARNPTAKFLDLALAMCDPKVALSRGRFHFPRQVARYVGISGSNMGRAKTCGPVPGGFTLTLGLEQPVTRQDPNPCAVRLVFETPVSRTSKANRT